jgi:hypothetical protein
MFRKALVVLGLSLAFALAHQATAHATLKLLKQNPSDPATFSGKGGYSADGLGQDGTTGGTVQAQVPGGSTVVQAYLYGSYFFNTAPDASERTIDFDGTNVVLSTLPNSEPGNSNLSTARATVTSQVSAKVGSGGGITNFAINDDPGSLDGVALVVIFSNPTLPQNTIAVLDGGSKQAGDTVTFNFASPIDKSAPGFAATMALGSGFSAQDQSPSGAAGTHTCGTDANQSSLIDVNSARLTSCAGNFDDGFLANGALITVGGVGDSTNNPSDPNQEPADGGTPRVQDDELYNLAPLMHTGDTHLTVDTSNPSTDDNLFLAIIATTAEAAVTTEVCDNGRDDDGDGLVDGKDPDCGGGGGGGPVWEGAHTDPASGCSAKVQSPYLDANQQVTAYTRVDCPKATKLTIRSRLRSDHRFDRPLFRNITVAQKGCLASSCVVNQPAGTRFYKLTCPKSTSRTSNQKYFTDIIIYAGTSPPPNSPFPQRSRPSTLSPFCAS